MIKQNIAMSCLLAVFPTHESLINLTAGSNNSQVIQSFIDYAARNNLITTHDFQSLESLIADNARSPGDCTPPDDLNFEELLDNMGKWLRINLSVRSLTDRINILIKNNQIALPNVSYSMLARLKAKPADTVYKQHALRSFAFWLGHERTNLGPSWNYETLLKLCPEDKLMENHKEGVRVGFALYSRGDVIDYATMNELKTSVKNYIERTLGNLRHGPWGKVKSLDLTTIYIDIPKESSFEGLGSYAHCLRVAIALSYEISIGWILSKFYTKNRFLSIGIVAGNFDSINNYLLPILNAKIHTDPIIRISDYVHRGISFNGLWVLFNQPPREISLFTGETFSMWWVTDLWGSLSYDFIPKLLEDRILENHTSPGKTLSQLLWFPEELDFRPGEDDKPDAVTTYLKFSHNSMLGLEIAKTLYYRRRLQESLEVLNLVLSTDPNDLMGRTLRSIILRELALSAPSYFIANQFLNRSEQEAFYAEKYCKIKSEDFYCEWAFLYLTKALLILRNLRAEDEIQDDMPKISLNKQDVFDALDKAEATFGNALAIVPVAIRATYSMNVIRILKIILHDDEDIFSNPQKPINGKLERVAYPWSGFRWQASLFKKETVLKGEPSEVQDDDHAKLMIKRFDERFNDSTSPSAFRASNCFCHAVSLWDFSLNRTIGITKRVLKILNDAIKFG